MVETPTVVPSLPPIKQVSIARNGNPSSTLFLANDGQVYGCGANPWGTLGLGQGVYQQNSPVPLPIDGVKAVAGISSMSVFIKANGDAYVCGVNKYGQLGLGDTTNRYVPTQIPGFGPVKQSAGHGSRCFHLLEDGSIYACGWFPDGELRVPTHVSFAPLSRWIGVSDTAIEYLADGVYRSALGTEVSDVGISPPVLLPTLGTVQELSVGVAYSSSSGSHSLILV
jgi:alpha-tubulin suppressor-like RCC1 family protein